MLRASLKEEKQRHKETKIAQGTLWREKWQNSEKDFI